MSERNFAIRYRIGASGNPYLHQGRLWASQQVAEQNFARLFREPEADPRQPAVVGIDVADLQPVAADEYQHAEARMLYWTTRCQQLRPGPLPSVEWQQLTSADVGELSRVANAWHGIRRWMDAGVDVSGVPVTHVVNTTDVALWRVLRRVLEKLGEEPR